MARRNKFHKGIENEARDETWIDRAIPVLSFNSRYLMRGYNDEFQKDIARTLGIEINMTSNSDAAINASTPPYATSIVQHFIQELDRSAQMIVQNRKIKTTRDINKDHHDLLKEKFTQLLDDTKDKLNKAKLADQKAAAAVAPKAELPVAAPANEAFFDAASGHQRSKSAERQSRNAMGGGFIPKNQSQAISYMACKDDNISVVFNVGDAGGGKTYSALAYALESEGKIYCFRPRTITGSGNLGAMKGTLAQKTLPYIQVILNKLKEMGRSAASSRFEMLTPDTSRGDTLGSGVTIVDEAQNLTVGEAKMLLTRMGRGGKFIFTGDISEHQNDLKGQFPGLAYLIGKLATAANGNNKGLQSGVAFIRFTEEDSESRHDLMPNILRAFNDQKSSFSEAFERAEGFARNSVQAKATREAVKIAAQELDKADKFTRNHYEAVAKAAFPVLWGGTNVLHIQRGPRSAGAMGGD